MSNYLVVGIYRDTGEKYSRVILASDPWHAQYLAEAEGSNLVVCAVFQPCVCGRINA